MKAALSKFFILTSILLVGCVTSQYERDYASTVDADLKLLGEYRANCDKAIAAKTYHHACDLYIDLADNQPYISDPKIAGQRQRFMLYREADRPRREQEEAAQRAKFFENKYSPSTLSKYDDRALCMQLYFGVDGALTGDTPYDKNINAELKKRGYTAKQISNARKKIISIGTPKCMMYAAMGMPDDENRTVTSSTVRIQHVYRSKGMYVYTVNGYIKSWQD